VLHSFRGGPFPGALGAHFKPSRPGPLAGKSSAGRIAGFRRSFLNRCTIGVQSNRLDQLPKDHSTWLCQVSGSWKGPLPLWYNRIMLRSWIWGVVLLAPWSAAWSADGLDLRSQQERLELIDGQERSSYLVLPNEGLFVFRVKGPDDVGLRVRAVLFEKEQEIPSVDLTVVRDGQEQGTVRFEFPKPDGAGSPSRKDIRISGEVLVKIEIPEGVHEYSLLLTGQRNGCLIHPFLGLRKKKGVVVPPRERPRRYPKLLGRSQSPSSRGPRS
jgi:hypothetical protein